MGFGLLASSSPRLKFASAKSEAKLGELIVYLAQKCADDPNFGATKLNKLLFFADFYSYLSTGRPITGVTYMKLPNGPAPRRLLPIRSRLEKEGAIKQIEMVFHGYKQKRVIAKRMPKLEMFSGTDISLVDTVIEMLSGANATKLSRMSHNIAWKIAPLNSDIPYESAFLSDDEPTDADIEWALSVAKDCGVNA